MLEPSEPVSWRFLLLLILLLGGLLMLGVYLEGRESLQPLRANLQSKVAHRSGFPGNRTLRFLNRVGALHPAPPKAVPKTLRGGSQGDGSDWRFAYWGVGPGDPSDLPSTQRIPERFENSSLPVLSISIRKSDLRGLLANPRARGRRTEKRVFVSFFDEDRLVFGTVGGLRLHGDTTRTRTAKKSYRLILRDTYGLDRFPPTIVRQPTAEPLRRIVLDSDLRHYRDGTEARFSDPLAYDIARQAGALTPSTRPMQVVINGKSQGLYTAIEYLDEIYIRSRYGHSRFTFVRTTGGGVSKVFRSGSLEHYRELLDVARAGPSAHDRLEQMVDLENLSRWFLSMLICGTLDAMEGSLLFDESQPEGRWFWINWDMDSSFGLAYRVGSESAWGLDVFRRIVRPAGRDVRSRALSSLIRHDSDFRSYLLALHTEIVNHRVTKRFIDERLNYYRQLAVRHGISEIAFIERYREFLEQRSVVLRQRLGEYLQGGASYPVQIEFPNARSLEIDGYIEESTYSGWYFEGMTLEMAVPEPSRGDFRFWVVNGESITTPEVRIEIESPLQIEAVFEVTRG